MRYYGIVNQLRQKPGWYGRKSPGSEEAQAVIRSTAGSTWAAGAAGVAALLVVAGPLPVVGLAVSILSWFSRRKQPLRLVHRLEDASLCLFSDNVLDEDYSLNGEDAKVLHGLISDASQFKALMSSEGGSELFLLERSQVDVLGLKHYGGIDAPFSPGLYCEHPKDNTVLLPLNTASDLLQSEILAEMIDVFEALGATRILIEDVTELSVTTSGGDGKVAAKASATAEKKVLRESRYAPDKPVDAARALQNKRHVRDLRNVMSIVEARTHGNQTYQRFEESVSVNCGLDVSVLGAFGAGIKGSFKRQWSFDVEFQSKQTSKPL